MKQRKKEVNTSGLGLSQHLSVLQTGGTEKGRTCFYAEQHRHTQPEHDMRSQPEQHMHSQLEQHMRTAGTAHAQPALNCG
jgi:hypothetical protein